MFYRLSPRIPLERFRETFEVRSRSVFRFSSIDNNPRGRDNVYFLGRCTVFHASVEMNVSRVYRAFHGRSLDRPRDRDETYARIERTFSKRSGQCVNSRRTRFRLTIERTDRTKTVLARGKINETIRYRDGGYSSDGFSYDPLLSERYVNGYSPAKHERSPGISISSVSRISANAIPFGGFEARNLDKRMRIL